MKTKWTFVDTLIVILVIAMGAALVKVFVVPQIVEEDKGTKRYIEAVILLSRQEEEIVDAIHKGDEITINLAEKDTAKLKDFEVKPAETMVYNAIDGKYVIEPVEDKVDIYATLKLKVNETDYAFKSGGTTIKVGEKLPFRGKGYALEGFIIEIHAD